MADAKFRHDHPQGPDGRFRYVNGGRGPAMPRAATPPPPAPEPDLNPPPPPVPQPDTGFGGNLDAFGDTWTPTASRGGFTADKQSWRAQDGATLTIDSTRHPYLDLTFGRTARVGRVWHYRSGDGTVDVTMGTDGTNSPVTVWHMRNADRAMRNHMLFVNGRRDPQVDAPIVACMVRGDNPWDMHVTPLYGTPPPRPVLRFWRRAAWDEARRRERAASEAGFSWMDDTVVTADVQRMLGDRPY